MSGQAFTPDAALQVGASLLGGGRLDDAERLFQGVLQVDADHAGALHLLGVVRERQRREAEAAALFERAARTGGGTYDACFSLGVALNALRRFDEALAWFVAAQAFQPDAFDAHWNECLIRLRAGDYARGFEKYEWRLRRHGATLRSADADHPRWTGREPLEGRTIYVHAEQGYGDTIQFVRYIDLLLQRGARVVASVQPPLRALVQQSFPGATVLAQQETMVLPAFDLHAPLPSLPYCFGTTVDSVPSRTPYLRVPAAAVEAWRARVGGKGRPRIGLAWAGNPGYPNDHERSLAAGALAPLLQDGVTWVALQRDLRGGDEAFLAARGIARPVEAFEDFADYAAVVAGLDRVPLRAVHGVGVDHGLGAVELDLGRALGDAGGVQGRARLIAPQLGVAGVELEEDVALLHPAALVDVDRVDDAAGRRGELRLGVVERQPQVFALGLHFPIRGAGMLDRFAVGDGACG